MLGPGGANCQRLEANAREAVATAGVAAEIRHLTDYREIVARGVLATSGLVIDGRLVASGQIPSAGDIATWLTGSRRPP